MYSLYSFVYYAQTPAALGHWSLTCPPQHSELVIAYLQRQKCKFNRKMQRTAWQKSVVEDRDIFTIEIISDKAVQSLIKATRDKGGLVIEPPKVEDQVDVFVTYDSLSDDHILEINGDIPDAKLVSKISELLKDNPRLVYYPETGRANGNLTRVLKTLGFNESDDCLFCDL